jgi:hypothetical protein
MYDPTSFEGDCIMHGTTCTDHMLPLITLITLTFMPFTIGLRGGTPA